LYTTFITFVYADDNDEADKLMDDAETTLSESAFLILAMATAGKDRLPTLMAYNGLYYLSD